MIKQQIITYSIDNKNINIEIRPNKIAKRIGIRFDIEKQLFILTAPPLIKKADITDALKRSEFWLRKQLQKKTISLCLCADANIRILDKYYVISHKHQEGFPYGEIKDDKIIIYSGDSGGFAINNLVIYYLQDMAHKELSTICYHYVEKINKKINKIRINDAKTMWGSCSEQGNIALNWKLLLAPKAIADYVCAHEVCHLVEMNHSKQFWSLVESIYPRYHIARQWLKQYGHELHRYGFH